MQKTVKIFLFSDALGYDLVQKYHFMSKELPIRQEVVTQFGYSSTAVPTILTGKKPTEHKHFSFFYRAEPGKSPFKLLANLRWLFHPRKLFDHPRARHKISQFFAKCAKYTGYFNLYRVPFERLSYLDYCEKTDIFACNALPVPNLRDMLEAKKIPYKISDWRAGDERNLAEAKAYLESGESGFIFIYTASLDGMLHFHVKDDAYVKKEFDGFAAKVRELLQIAHRNYQEVAFYLFSDHGMTPLAGAADVKAEVERLPYRFGRDYLACYDSTMMRLWCSEPVTKTAIMATVQKQPGHWLSEAEKKELNIDFADHQYGDEIFLLNPGIQLAPSDMGAKAIPGMHGFAPADKHSAACIMSEKVLPRPVLSIADYFDLMEYEAEQLRLELA